ncbi:MAG: LysR family transcriptional regulator [Burkholderiales bacterium]|nr:LysR family transcriptional regulator [Burkholderiales bacterium]
MTLKQLEAFYWAATCINFAVAAQRVHLSVSSLSKRIGELENSLNVQLFDRSGRNAKLTERGEQLLPRVREFLRASVQLQQSVGQHLGLQGRCRLGMGELSALTWLPDLVRKAAELHPALEIEPCVDIGQVLEQRIDDGELDCVVIAGYASRNHLATEIVGDGQFVWVASRELIERAGADHPRLLIGNQTLVSLPDGAGSTRILDQWLSEQRVSVNRRLTCNNWGAVVGMFVAGTGFGFMPTRWAQELEARAALQILARDETLAPLTYAAQWRRDDSRLLISELREMIKFCFHLTAPRALT